MEEWRSVVGYEGLYDISSQGRVRRADTQEECKQLATYYGYQQVRLYDHDGKGKYHFVHRVVAIAFIENDDPERGLVDHINRVRNCNTVENLRWATHRENSANSSANGESPWPRKRRKPVDLGW